MRSVCLFLLYWVLCTSVCMAVDPCLDCPEPRRTADSDDIDVIPLAKMDISGMTCGSGKAQKGRANEGKPLVIGGETYACGVGTHAPSRYELAVDGGALSFAAHVGVDHETEVIAGHYGAEFVAAVAHRVPAAVSHSYPIVIIGLHAAFNFHVQLCGKIRAEYFRRGSIVRYADLRHVKHRRSGIAPVSLCVFYLVIVTAGIKYFHGGFGRILRGFVIHEAVAVERVMDRQHAVGYGDVHESIIVLLYLGAYGLLGHGQLAVSADHKCI